MVNYNTIQGCKSRKAASEKELYNNTIKYTYSTVLRYIKNQEEIKDCIQDAYANVFYKISKYDDRKGEFKYWLRKIVVNTCLMHIRKNNTTPSFIDATENEDQLEAHDDNIEGLTRKDIDDLLQFMPPRYKIIFMMYCIDGFNHKEISKTLNITDAASRSILSKAKKWIISNILENKKQNIYGIF